MAAKYKDIYSGIFFFLLSIFLYSLSFTIRISTADALGPQFFPRMVAFLMAVLSITLVVKGVTAIRKEKSKATADTNADKKANNKLNYSLILSCLLLIAYMLLIKHMGFIIMSVIYLFCQILLISPKEDMARKNIIIYGIISVVVPVALYYVFYNVFSIFLPTGLLG